MGYCCLFGVFCLVVFFYFFFWLLIGVWFCLFVFFSVNLFQTLFSSFTKVAIKYISYGDINTCLWLNRQEKKSYFTTARQFCFDVLVQLSASTMPFNKHIFVS